MLNEGLGVALKEGLELSLLLDEGLDVMLRELLPEPEETVSAEL